MHNQFTPDVYTVGQHGYESHQNKIQNNRRCHSEQLIRNRTKLSSPSSYSLNGSIAYESASLTRVNYSPKNLFSLVTPTSNRRNSVCCTPTTQNVNSSIFDKYSPIDENASLCVRSTPTQLGTPSFDKYMTPYDSPRQNVHNRSALKSNFSLDAVENNWSLLSNNSKTPTRARAYSVDSPQNVGQLLSLHFSPCSCKSNNSKRMSFTSPMSACSSSSASTPSLNCCPEPSPQRSLSQGTVLERWQQTNKEIPSPMNIYLRTRKRNARASAYNCHACN